MPYASSEFSFVVATAETKGSTGFSSGLVSLINAHTARTAHARRRDKRNQTSEANTRRVNSLDCRKPRNSRRSRKVLDELAEIESAEEVDNSSIGVLQDVDPALPAKRDMTFSCPQQCSGVPSRTAVRPKVTFLDSSLSSSVNLPMVCSRKEVGLLHFYLTYGRRLQLGTSATPKYDPGLDVMHKLIEVSPAYLLVHLVISQKLLCDVTADELPPESYKYQADAYRIVNARLGDHAIPVQLRIFDLIQLTMLEFSMNRWKQAVIHTEALERLVESRGGMKVFLDHKRRFALLMEPRFYMGMFLRVYVPIKDLATLKRTLDRMLEYFEAIKKWMKLQRAHRSVINDEICPDHKLERSAIRKSLQPLRAYLEALTQNCDDFETPTAIQTQSMRTQTYICSWMICMTLAEHEVIGHEATLLLKEVQDYMLGSCEISLGSENPLTSLFVGTVVNTVSYVRRNRYPNRVVEELNICQAGIDVLKCFRLLDIPLKATLSKKLCAHVLSTIDDRYDDVFDDAFVFELQAAIINKWTSLNQKPEFSSKK